MVRKFINSVLVASTLFLYAPIISADNTAVKLQNAKLTERCMASEVNRRFALKIMVDYVDEPPWKYWDAFEGGMKEKYDGPIDFANALMEFICRKGN